MKKILLFLSSLSLILVGCNSASKKDDDSKEDTKVVMDTNLVGNWYINSSSTGTVGINLPFTVYSNETVSFGGQIFTLKGNYSNYTSVFQFVYGDYYVMLEYDYTASAPELNYAYQHGDASSENYEYDFGYATHNEISTYDYVGSEWPMSKINAYLGTTGNLPAIESDTYYLDLFKSSLYNCESADIEVRNCTLEKTNLYIQFLMNSGYTFSTFDSSKMKSNTFYVGQDLTGVYTLRINCMSSDNGYDTHIFVYKYNENIKS